MLGIGLSLPVAALLGGAANKPSLDLNFLAGSLDSRITFTRASSGTYTDSAGVLRRVGYNTTLQSQTFDHASWVKNLVTVQPNVAADPFGGMNADKMVPDAGSGQFHELRQDSARTAGVTYVFSQYVKAAGYRYVQLLGSGTAFGSFAINFDLDTGTETAFTAGTSTIVGRGIIGAGNGWYRIWVANTSLATAAGRFSFNIVPATNSARGVTWTPNGTDGVFIFGAQNEDGVTSPGDYSPTTSAANGGPRFDHAITTPTVNLLTWSEDFSNAAWPRVRSGITANGTTDPLGGTTADKLTEQTDTATNRSITQNISVTSGTTYAISVYAKAAERSAINLRFASGFAAGNVTFDLTNRTATPGGTVAASSISDAGNGWRRCSASFTATSTTTAGAQVFLHNGSSITYDGVSGNGVYLWGAQVEQSAALGTYVPTSGIPARIGGSTTNLVLQSNSFSTAPWTVNALSVAASAGVGPDGSASAWKLIEAASSVEHFLEQAVAVTAQSYVMSVYAKAAERTRIVLRVGNFGTAGPQQAVFTLTGSGSTSILTGTPTASITALPNGWYRCAAVFTATSAQTSVFRVHPYDGVQLPYAGDGTSGVLIQGAQLETGSSLGPYVASTSAAATANVTEARGLLIEEARTNVFTPGANLATYLAKQGGATATDEAAIVSPYGTTGGVARISAPDFTNRVEKYFAAVASDTAQQWSSSVFVRAVSGTVSGSVVATDGASHLGLIAFTVGTAWTRISASQPVGTSAGTARLWRLYGLTGEVYIACPQFEAGTFATSYIPTTTASATRAADAAVISTLTPWFNASAGTLQVEASLSGSVATKNLTTLSDGTANETYQVNTTSGGAVRWQVTDGGAGQVAITTSVTAAADTAFKFAGTFSTNDFAASSNGGAVGTDTSGTLPTVDRLHLGASGTGSSQMTGHIRRVRYFPARKQNAELQTLTA